MNQISGAAQVAAYYTGRQVQQGQSSWMGRDPAGNVTVHGSGADDRITVSEHTPHGPGNYNLWGPTKYLKVQVNNDTYLIPLNGRNAAKSIGIYAGAGNDSVVVDPNVTTPLFISGGAGNDYLKGGNGPNSLLGGTGNDTLIGGRSNDLLMGGQGFDTVVGRGGRDMYSLSDLYNRLHQGHCHRPPLTYNPPSPVPLPSPSLPPVISKPVEPVQPLPPPSPVVVAPPPPPPVIIKKPPVQRPTPPKPQPQTPPRPSLSSLFDKVDTYDGEGFNAGRDMTKSLLAALYDSPAKLRSVLASIGSAKQRDDAAAAFARALLESGPSGGRLLKGLPADIKKTLSQYIGSGDSWSANKKGVFTVLSKLAGTPSNRFTDKDTQEAVRRYEGVF